jgi:hypothetical protein
MSNSTYSNMHDPPQGDIRELHYIYTVVYLPVSFRGPENNQVRGDLIIYSLHTFVTWVNIAPTLCIIA